jgi:hypothetical protein
MYGSANASSSDRASLPSNSPDRPLRCRQTRSARGGTG